MALLPLVIAVISGLLLTLPLLLLLPSLLRLAYGRGAAGSPTPGEA